MLYTKTLLFESIKNYLLSQKLVISQLNKEKKSVLSTNNYLRLLCIIIFNTGTILVLIISMINENACTLKLCIRQFIN